MRRLIIEPLLSEQQAAVSTAPADRTEAERLRPESRRLEFLTWRTIVRRELGADVLITYNTPGAPQVVDRDVYIGVSHCRGRVAVCISDAPCAVDIEPEERDFTRAALHYVTAAERGLSDDPLWLATVWCAKETLYKFSGRKGLDLLRDLHIEAVDPSAGKVWGRIENGEPIELSVRRGDGFIAVYIL